MKLPFRMQRKTKHASNSKWLLGLSPAVAAIVLLGFFVVSSTITAASIILIGRQGNGSVTVPTNQVLKTAGTSTLLSQRPTDIALSPNGKQIAVTTTNLTFLINAQTGEISQGIEKADRSVAGLAYSPDGKHLYYSKSTDHGVSVVSIDKSGNATVEASIDTGNNTWPSGLSVSPDGKTLYVALFGTNSMGIIDLTTNKLVTSVPVGSSPFGSYVSPNGKKVYTTNWGGTLPVKGDLTDPLFPVKIDPKTGAAAGGSVSVYDVSSGKIQTELQVGHHPTAVTFDSGSTRLYVANSNDDTISVINLNPKANFKEIERINVRPCAGLPFGSMPNGIALDEDRGLLYVANGGNNALAVVNLSDESAPSDDSGRNSRVKQAQPKSTVQQQNSSDNLGCNGNEDKAGSNLDGFIPTEWFPVGVVLSKDFKHLFVANNKGLGSINNLPEFEAKSVFNLTGSVSFINKPDGDQLEQYTEQVIQNSHYIGSLVSSIKKPRPEAKPVPIPERVGEPSVFKHVIYFIKENRTYDQVFGDIGKGNSDPNITQFGNSVSPNHHAIANSFGLLDNYYASSVNSADGHQWTDQAIANVFAERVYGFYPTNSPIPGVDSYGDSSLDLAPDSLWSNAIQHGISFRNYGENGSTTVFKNGNPTSNYSWSDIYTDWKNKTGIYTFNTFAITPPLEKNIDPKFPAFDTKIPDQVRADEWLREFNDYVKNGNLPQLEVVWLPDDHTSGVRTGSPTPSAQVADNDLALGRMMDALSHSPYWKDTVVLSTEDDAQNGVDHVDGHRTVGLVLSAYNKKGTIDSTLYNQTSVVRTIEQILGLKPMNQFDLTAPLMTNLFNNKADLTPYNVLPNQVPLDQITGQPQTLKGQLKRDVVASNQMDFSVPDANDPAVLNQIIWRSTNPNESYPMFDWLKRELRSGGLEADDDDANTQTVQPTTVNGQNVTTGKDSNVNGNNN